MSSPVLADLNAAIWYVNALSLGVILVFGYLLVKR